MRPRSAIPTGDRGPPLLRPLLGWRRQELVSVCAAAGVEPVDDPANSDDRFERARIRSALRETDWLDPQAVARSASHLAAADEALDWAALAEWNARVDREPGLIRYSPSDAPAEIRWRILIMAVGLLGHEGEGEELRGRELDRLLAELEAGRTATLRGVRCTGGKEWRFTQAPPRKS